MSDLDFPDQMVFRPLLQPIPQILLGAYLKVVVCQEETLTPDSRNSPCLECE